MMNSSFSRDDELNRLRVENQNLAADLRQCQNDKDFVWSLWKKLQVANPDVSKAISLVVQREKEKAELKDRKVLEVLQMKDDRIEELQTILSLKSRELGDVAIRRIDHQEDLNRLQREIEELRDRNANLEMQFRMRGINMPSPRLTWKLRGLESRERSSGDLHRSTVESLSKDKHDMEQRLRKMTTELEIARAERESTLAEKINLENKVRLLERDVSGSMVKFEGIIGELEEAKRILQQYETKSQQLVKEIEFKNGELETVRKELSDLWHSHNQLTEHSSQQADLIRQLQSLQQDTQKMLKNQEDAYSLETNSLQDMYKDLTSRYEVAKRGETDLRQELHELRKELIDKDSVISTLQMKVDNFHKRRRSRSPGTSGSFISEDQPFVDLEFKVKSMQREINLLRDSIEDKDRYIDKLERDRDKLDIEFDVSSLNKRERTHSTPARELKSVALSPIKSTIKSEVTRSRSLSPVRRSREKREINSLNFRQGDLRHKLIQSERKMEDTKNMLRLKNRELEELKKAHAKRYERLKSIQTDYKILKDQVKLLEEDNSKTRGRKKKRSDPKDLRHEDSDKVWNELAFFKNENRGLIVERMSLEEELDTMKVQTSENEATIHELKVALQQERENRQYDKKKSEFNTQEKSDLQSELTLMKSDLQSKMIRLEKLEKDTRETRAEKEALLDEKRLLKNEVMDLKQSEAKYRMEAANLKRDINRLERELEDERLNRQIEQSKEKHMALKAGKPAVKVRKLDHRSKTKAAKQYQKSLNRSIEKMKSVFKDFEDDGWEEVQETEEGEGTESDSLGQTIADMSQPTDDSTEGTKHRLKPQSFKMSSVQRSRRAALRNLQHRHRNLMRSASNLKQPPSNSDQAKTVTVQEAGTSMSPKKELSPPPKVQEQRMYEQRVHANNQILRQLKQSKQRLGYLQQHITTIKDAKKIAVKALNEQKEASQQLQNDLNLANQRLRLAKQNIQKLTSDLDKALQEKADLASQVMEENRHTTAQDKHTEQDWKILESRLKASSNEVCRQSGQVRQLKQDNDHLQEQIKSLQDKINRLERDNNQKRTLLEDQRMKLKLAQTNAKSEQNANEEMETRLKLVQDTCDRYKIQIDSFKKRLAAVTREKREYEEKFLKINNELEKKSKLFMDSQTRSMELESAVGELEKTAQQQLCSLASQSEAAIEAAQDKLSSSFYTIQQYQHFVKTLGKELIKKINQSRIQLKDVQLQHEQLKLASETERSASMQKAQAMAKDILNLSQSDLDEIMSADGDSDRLSMDDEISADKRRDKRWSKKCEKLLNLKDDFVLPLVDLFIQKIEERCELVMKLQGR